MPCVYIGECYFVPLKWGERGMGTLMLQVTGCGEYAEVDNAGAVRWVAAVNSGRRQGLWEYQVVCEPLAPPGAVGAAAQHRIGLCTPRFQWADGSLPMRRLHCVISGLTASIAFL